MASRSRFGSGATDWRSSSSHRQTGFRLPQFEANWITWWCIVSASQGKCCLPRPVFFDPFVPIMMASV